VKPSGGKEADMTRDEVMVEELQKRLAERIAGGSACGPFMAAIADAEGNVLAEAANSVVESGQSHCHAEMNAIALAERKLGHWNLSGRGLTLYSSAEPCMMCLGGILWCGIERVVYGVSTADVERITGFDEGFKPKWREEFAKRGIEVVGPLLEDLGRSVLADYVRHAGLIYQSRRAVPPPQ
jgi:tRNA(Arg) A34 adenosine deaminase TadA